jgi:hypothetical protein
MRKYSRKRLRQEPGIETLEAKTLLSSLRMTEVVHALSAEVSGIRAAALPSLTTRGIYARVQVNPDTGRTYFFQTFGSSPFFGTALVVGSITTPGFVATGQAAGTLTLYSAKGVLTVSVSKTVPGFSSLPSQLGFTITGGTGQFSNLHGSGTLTDTIYQTWGGPPAPVSLTGGSAVLSFQLA